MAVTAVVGAQWGDEGKGRVVDWLTARADLVVRFQGGDNAGHTVVNEYGKFHLHIVPSGIFHPGVQCVVGTGTVVNPDNLLEELRVLDDSGVDTSRLVVSDRAHIVFPFHRLIDGLEEAARNQGAIGTTKRGIGPAYANKASRIGLQMGDLLELDYFEERLHALADRTDRLLAALDHGPLERSALLQKAAAWREALGDRIVDTLPLLQDAVQGGKRVLLEGQLGAMRDLDWGTYPFVTSSNPIAGAASAGAGLPPHAIDRVLGIVKAYSTAVGAGPFPTELTDDLGDALRAAGDEYGATTGRPRRCGWFDAVAVRHSAWLNGFSGVAVTKLDVLDGMDSLRICTGYELDGETVQHVPSMPRYARARPIYEDMPGWTSNTSEARHWDDLPKEAQAYLERIREVCGTPLWLVSVGPERDAMIELPPSKEAWG